jgi:hypothetical protein
MNYDLWKMAREYSVNSWPVQLAVNNARSVVQPYLTPQFEATKITKNVYIGNFASACHLEMLKFHNIKHIIVAAYGLWEMFPGEFSYKQVNVIDSEYSSLRPHYQEISDYIFDMAVIRDENVLVHCVAGVSRSASLVAAYLIQTQGMTAYAAISEIRNTRPQIAPNTAFMNELHLLEPIKYDIDVGSLQQPSKARFRRRRPLKVSNELDLTSPRSSHSSSSYTPKPVSPPQDPNINPLTTPRRSPIRPPRPDQSKKARPYNFNMF